MTIKLPVHLQEALDNFKKAEKEKADKFGFTIEEITSDQIFGE